MVDFTQDLIAAASRGDLSAVKDFIESGADWRADNQRALKLAMQGQHRDVMQYFLEDLILPQVRQETHQRFQNGFIPTEDDVQTDLGRVRASIRAGVAEPPSYSITLLTLSIQYGATGAFDALLAQDKQTTLKYAPLACAMTGKTDFVEKLLAAGAAPDFATGTIVNKMVQSVDMAGLAVLAKAGFDFNRVEYAGQSFVHPLRTALDIQDAEQRKAVARFLHDHGADLRINGLKHVARQALTKDSDIFDFCDFLTPGTQLPMLLALAEDAKDPKGARDVFIERFPFMKSWYMYDFVEPLMNGTATGQDRWFENVRMTDRGADDNILIKMAVMSAQDKAMVPFLLGAGGIRLNTKNDKPLTLAVMLGKAHLLETFGYFDVDPYAEKAEAFRINSALKNADMDQALKALAKKTEKSSQKKLMLRAPKGLTTDVLVAGPSDTNTGETGLYLAAKAGMTRLLAKQGLLSGLSAEDFLKPMPSGGTVAAVLSARGEVDVLMSPDIWGQKTDDAERIYATLSSADQKQSASTYALLMQHKLAAETRQRLKEKLPRLQLPARPPSPQKPKKD